MPNVLPRRIYAASSWRNPIQPEIVRRMRDAGHEVYDFRHPAPGQEGFSWLDCGGEAAAGGPDAGARTIPAYLEAVRSKRAAQGFALDEAALEWCDTCILVLPCGRSAHLELGYAAGQGKDTYVLLHEDKFEPELMYLLNTGIATDIEQILAWMAERQPGDVRRWHVSSGGHFARPAGLALRLLREVVELCVAAGATEDEIIGHTVEEIAKARQRNEFGGDPLAVSGEWADCAILLKVFAHHAGIHESQTARAKLDVLWRRAWEPGASGALYRPGSVPVFDRVLDGLLREPDPLAQGGA